MALTDMKFSAAERKEEKAEMTIPSAPKYPWGLSLNLDGGSLDKLGVKDLPKVGDYITVVALCCVKSVSQTSTEGDDDDCKSVSLQIEKMRLGGDGDNDDDDKMPKGRRMPVAKSIVSKYSDRKED